MALHASLFLYSLNRSILNFLNRLILSQYRKLSKLGWFNVRFCCATCTTILESRQYWECKMIGDIDRFRLWSEVDFAGLLSPIAIGASFEGLANFLMARIPDASTRPNTFPINRPAFNCAYSCIGGGVSYSPPEQHACSSSSASVRDFSLGPPGGGPFTQAEVANNSTNQKVYGHFGVADTVPSLDAVSRHSLARPIPESSFIARVAHTFRRASIMFYMPFQRPSHPVLTSPVASSSVGFPSAQPTGL